ncbi:hypothetical protein BMS3Bbin07_00645 [bacterium BMS3Bbin07]|nr:hypothetical protein BMS3Bbin07_00645 [bacterium BMS3Bbin07]
MSVQCPCHRVNYGISDGAVIFVPVIIGGDVIISCIENRPDQKFDPFRCYASEVGIHHRAGLYIKGFCYLKDGPECTPLSRNPMIGGNNLVEVSHPVMKQYGVKINSGFPDDIHGSIS